MSIVFHIIKEKNILKIYVIKIKIKNNRKNVMKDQNSGVIGKKSKYVHTYVLHLKYIVKMVKKSHHAN